jgi:hypothetical protein
LIGNIIKININKMNLKIKKIKIHILNNQDKCLDKNKSTIKRTFYSFAQPWDVKIRETIKPYKAKA